MARTIAEIEQGITENLYARFALSSSAVAEWRMWVHVAAMAMNTFELIMDRFKGEIEGITNDLRPGTLNWYTDMCYRFQNGYALVYDKNTALYGYAVDDESSKIVAIASVSESESGLVFRVAKKSGADIVPFSDNERLNFKNYIDLIKFAGTRTSVISTRADLVLYAVDVFYDLSVPQSVINERLKGVLAAFKTEQVFGGRLYAGRFMDSIMNVEGVVTAYCADLLYKGASDAVYNPVEIFVQLEAGYFNYDPDSSLTLKPISEL